MIAGPGGRPGGPTAGEQVGDRTLLRKSAAVGVLDVQVVPGLGRIHEDRRAVGLPCSAHLPGGRGIGQNSLRGGQEIGLGVGAQPAQKGPVLG